MDVVRLYATYVKKNYGSGCHIVFDGYESGPSNKDHEHDRRSRHHHLPQTFKLVGQIQFTINRKLSSEMGTTNLNLYVY